MSNYKDLGYNMFLERPFQQMSPKYTSQQFDSMIENFSWNKGSGGNVNLGGNGNSSGLIYVTFIYIRYIT